MARFKRGELLLIRRGDKNVLALVCDSLAEDHPTYIIAYETDKFGDGLHFDLVTEDAVLGDIRFSDKLAGLGRYIMPSKNPMAEKVAITPT